MSGASASVNRKLYIRRAGKIANFQWKLPATGTARSSTLRKNGTNQTPTLSPADSTAGLFADKLNSFDVASGDYIDVTRTITTAPANTGYSFTFQADSGHFTTYATMSTTMSVATGVFSATGASTTNATTEASSQLLHRVAGDIKNIFALVSANTNTSGTSTITARINGANKTNTVSFAFGVTGLFEDTSHSDAVVSGDLVCFGFSGNASGSATIAIAGMGFLVSASTPTNDVFTGPGVAGTSASYAGGTTAYGQICGQLSQLDTTESLVSWAHGFPVKMEKLRTHVLTSTTTGTGTFAIRINGATGNQTVSIGAGLTGFFEDTTNVDYAGGADLVNYIWSGGTSGTCNMAHAMLTETDMPETGWMASLTSADVAGDLARLRTIMEPVG